MQINSVQKYLDSNVRMPYFLFISDGHYKMAMDELRGCGLDFVQLSSFCCSDDKIPDIDELLTSIEEANGKKLVITGLGEFLSLRGRNEAVRTLLRLKDYNIGDAKVVLLLRGLASLIAELQADPRFDYRRYNIVDSAECDLSFILIAPSIESLALAGFKVMLAELENGLCGSVTVNTAVSLDNALFTVRKISNSYDGIKLAVKDLALTRSCGSDARWAELLTELNLNNGSLEKIFEKYGLHGNIESDFYARISGNDYSNWLYFICLKIKADIIQNKYLRFVLNKTCCFEDFVKNVLNAIIEIKHTDSRFESFYQERKALVEKFPESDIAKFVVDNREVLSESIYKLTDCTNVEREEIIACLSNNNTIPSEIANIYPALASYMKKYIFKCPELADLLTEYFEAYKRQKLFNKIEPEFLEKVDNLALSRKYNRLPTRDEIIDRIDKNDTYLYWLDALGVEYLSIIEALVQKRGLSVNINIARAELPTITVINRSFFDSWQGHKDKNDELDETKHRDKGGYNFSNNRLPIHLAKELDIITTMIDKAATELALRRFKRFLIVSDHGASRLAVLRRKV